MKQKFSKAKNMFVQLLFILLFACNSLITQTVRSTPAQAKDMALSAIAFYKANGKKKAIAEFNNPKGRFTVDDLYILAYTMDGVFLAHGGNLKIVGQNFLNMKDAENKYFIREGIEICKSKGKGWQTYKWMNPVTKTIEYKALYIERVDNIIIGCGAYKK